MENTKPFDEIRKYKGRRRPPIFVRIVGLTLVGVIFSAVFALVFGLVVKWLWNALMPGIFGLGEIGYWQAVGLVLLTKLLFGSFGHSQPNTRRGPEWPGGLRHPREPWTFCHGDTRMKDRFRKWHYYKQFWKDEGQAAFDDYVDRVEQNGKEQEDHDL